MRNLSNTEFRIWQKQLLENISAPSDREVIWVWGQAGNGGKTWFQGYENIKCTTCTSITTAEYEGYIFVQRTESN